MQKNIKHFLIETGIHPTLKRIFLIMLVHAVLPTIAILVYLNLGQREIAVNSFKYNLLQIARFTANSYQEEFTKTRHLLNLLALLPEVKTYNTKECEQITKSILKSDTNVSYSNIGAVKTNGDIFCSALPLPNAMNVSDQEVFVEAIKAQNFYIGEYRISSINKKAMVPTTSPILNNKGELVGLTFASLDLEWFNKIANQVKLPQNYSITVLDKDNTVIARHPNSDNWIGKSLATTDLGQKLMEQNETEGTFTAFRLDDEKVQRLYAYTKFRNSATLGNISIVIGVPQSEITKSANQNLPKDIFFLLIIIVTTALVVAWDWRFILSKTLTKDHSKILNSH